ncbi:protein O-GlcNAcase [Brevibacillus fluminis]|uniref:protein O-GlcNAcase n=1 Tax=Brevibacillus fluminis TaxID=511487 RepID=UPI003F893488
MSQADFFAIRGVIEGFYGKPWTHEERVDMLAFLGRHRFNAYFYAPKDDLYLREDWQKPHTEASLAKISALIAHARQAGLAFYYCLSPGLSMQYASEAHFDKLLGKYHQLFSIGVRRFALLFDDIPAGLMHAEDKRVFRSLAEAHAAVTNRLQTELASWSEENQLIVCPTLYHGTGDEPYVRELGQLVPTQIPLFWTGRFVCSPMLTEADARHFAESTGHLPFYWDNYPVNDLAMAHELHIGPIRHRDPGLHRYAAGYMANAMEYAEASKIALATIGEYLDDPYGYDPESAWRRAIQEQVGEEGAERFLAFADNVQSSCLTDVESPRLLETFQQFRFNFLHGANPGQAVGELTRLFAEMEESADWLLTQLKNDKLKQEVRPWLVKYWHWARAGKLTAQLIAAGLENRMLQAASLYLQLHRWLKRTERLPHRVCGSVMRLLIDAVLQEVAKRR